MKKVISLVWIVLWASITGLLLKEKDFAPAFVSLVVMIFPLIPLLSVSPKDRLSMSPGSWWKCKGWFFMKTDKGLCGFDIYGKWVHSIPHKTFENETLEKATLSEIRFKTEGEAKKRGFDVPNHATIVDAKGLYCGQKGYKRNDQLVAETTHRILSSVDGVWCQPVN